MFDRDDDTYIEVLVGIIGSGKSSYCVEKAKNGWLRINDDSITNMLHSDIYTLYVPKLKDLYKQIRFDILESCLYYDKNVIIDSTNLTKRKRSEYIKLGKEWGVKVNAIVFPLESPEIHAKRRFDHDPRGYSYEKWLEVAQEQTSIYDSVCDEEGFNSIIRIK